MKGRAESQARSVLRERLEARRPEIEEAVLTRMGAIADPDEVSDPVYAEGLRASVAAALEYALEVIEAGEREHPPPVVLLAQARLAARSGISLDTVLRRYIAGYSLLGHFLLEEAGRERLMGPAELQRLAGAQAGLFDRLLAAVGEEHGRESDRHVLSTEERQAERVVRLLEGEMIDTAGVPYDFEGWHLGMAASGKEAKEATRALAGPGNCGLLSIERPDGVVWTWLGTRSGPDSLQADRIGAAEIVATVSLAVGEPGEGLAGWRLTHRQAGAALPIAERGKQSPVRYVDVAVLAAAIHDDTLRRSLRCLYLEPITRARLSNKVAKQTLDAYIKADGNMSSAASILRVKRHTVTNRLRTIERVTGRSVCACAAEMLAALRLDDLNSAYRPV